MRQLIIPALAILAGSIVPAMAQESGGIALAPQVARGPTGLARVLPSIRPGPPAADMQANLTAGDRSARDQDMVASLRGDAGYLGGFMFGTPLSASVQPMQQIPLAADPGSGPSNGSGHGGHWHGHGGGGSRQIVVNRVDVTTFQGPVVVGSNNNVQQQTASGSGPIALQQVMSQPGASPMGGAVNTIGPNGNIIQRVPGAVRSRPARVAAPR